MGGTLLRITAWTAASVIAFVLYIPPTAGAQSLPAAPRARIINLTPRAGFFDEPSIAVDPAHPKRVVAAYQVPAHAAYSRDSGRAWKRARGVADPNYRMSGDVSVTFGRNGFAFLCYIAFDQLGTANYWAHNATRNGIFVRRSPDGGITWQAPVQVIAHPTAPHIPFEDKPYIVADNTHSPFAGNLYIGWTHFTLTDSEIYFSRSTDDGAEWSKPIRISVHQGLPRDDNGAVEGFDGTVGAHGTLYVVWTDGEHIVFTLSKDGGKTFEPARDIIATAPPYFHVFDVSRANGFPQIGIGPSKEGPARLYVTWSDYRNGDVDVFCSNSNNGGETWAPAVRVNNDALHNGDDQFFQWLAVDPVTGAANVIFYDRRGDPANRWTRVVLARSTNGGKSFVNYAWNRRAFDAHGDFIGDYTGLAAYDNRVYGAWTEEGAGRDAAAADSNGGSAPPSVPAFFPRRRTTVRAGVADFSKH